MSPKHPLFAFGPGGAPWLRLDGSVLTTPLVTVYRVSNAMFTSLNDATDTGQGFTGQLGHAVKTAETRPGVNKFAGASALGQPKGIRSA